MANEIDMAKEIREFPISYPDFTIEAIKCSNVRLKYKGEELGEYQSPGRAKCSISRHMRRINKVDRNCMCCGNAFKAEGRFNRLCDYCKTIRIYD